MRAVESIGVSTSLVAVCSVLMHVFLTKSWLVAVWLAINLFVALLQLFAVSHRNRITRNYCINPVIDMWSRSDYAPHQKNFWMDGIAHYGCAGDDRFMDPQSVVYAILMLNVFLVAGMFVALSVYGASNAVFINIVLLQAVNTAIYYGTLGYKRWKQNDWGRISGWLALPLLWLVFPLAILLVAK